MNTYTFNEFNNTATVSQSYKKGGFNITISTPDISEIERQKYDILIKGKLSELLNKTKV